MATVTAHRELTVTKMVTASRDWAVTWAVIELWPSRDWVVIILKMPWLSCDLPVTELWPSRDLSCDLAITELCSAAEKAKSWVAQWTTHDWWLGDPSQFWVVRQLYTETIKSIKELVKTSQSVFTLYSDTSTQTYRWFRARLQSFRCVSNGDTAVLC